MIVQFKGAWLGYRDGQTAEVSDADGNDLVAAGKCIAVQETSSIDEVLPADYTDESIQAEQEERQEVEE